MELVRTMELVASAHCWHNSAFVVTPNFYRIFMLADGRPRYLPRSTAPACLLEDARGTAVETGNMAGDLPIVRAFRPLGKKV